MNNKEKWVIYDWIGNVCFDSEEFDSFEEAESFLTIKLNNYDEDRCEYFIEIKKKRKELRHVYRCNF